MNRILMTAVIAITVSVSAVSVYLVLTDSDGPPGFEIDGDDLDLLSAETKDRFRLKADQGSAEMFVRKAAICATVVGAIISVISISSWPFSSSTSKTISQQKVSIPSRSTEWF